MGYRLSLSMQEQYETIIGRAGASPPSRATGAQILLGERERAHLV